MSKSRPTYKVVDLFGNTETRFVETDTREKTLFDDYEGFVEKFKRKKTTDDCYTPKEVYDVVLNYVDERYSLEGKEIIRPFYPDGDYEGIDYSENSVVIDNPPFSIITQICRFYIRNDIKFFLFAPHLTNFGSDIDCTHIVASANIMYDNGATIKTSFLSNLFGDKKIIGCLILHNRLKEVEERNKVNLPKYVYPKNIITVSKIAYCVEKGVAFECDKKDVLHYRQMDDQKTHGKALFGSGFVCSDKAAEALERARAEARAEATDESNVIEWKLSEREKEIIKSLG